MEEGLRVLCCVSARERTGAHGSAREGERTRGGGAHPRGGRGGGGRETRNWLIYT